MKFSVADSLNSVSYSQKQFRGLINGNIRETIEGIFEIFEHLYMVRFQISVGVLIATKCGE